MLLHHPDRTHLTIPATVERVMGIAAGLPEGLHVLKISDGGRKTNDEAGLSSFVLAGGHSSGYDVLIAGELLHQAGHRILAAGLRPGRCAVGAPTQPWASITCPCWSLR